MFPNQLMGKLINETDKLVKLKPFLSVVMCSIDNFESKLIFFWVNFG